jgi:hypothetical protein
MDVRRQRWFKVEGRELTSRSNAQTPCHQRMIFEQRHLVRACTRFARKSPIGNDTQQRSGPRLWGAERH